MYATHIDVYCFCVVKMEDLYPIAVFLDLVGLRDNFARNDFFTSDWVFKPVNLVQTGEISVMRYWVQE